MFCLKFSEFDQIIGAFRIILVAGDGPDAFEAENWIEAREMVDARHLRHIPGYGWFLKS